MHPTGPQDEERSAQEGDFYVENDSTDDGGDEVFGDTSTVEGAESLGAADDSVAPDTGLSKLQAERDSLFERLARTTADYQNSRRRLEGEMESRLQYANANLIKSLLPVIDNFERALLVDPKTDPTSILKGLQVVHDQMLSVLNAQKVEEIAPEVGTPFDPAQHAALMQQPSDKYTEPTVTQLLQKGYRLGERTLRPASVAVSRTE